MLKLVEQLFCKHIYKGTNIEILYWKREKNGEIGIMNLPAYSNYVYFARSEQCLKCKKDRIVKGKQSIGNQIPEDIEHYG